MPTQDQTGPSRPRTRNFEKFRIFEKFAFPVGNGNGFKVVAISDGERPKFFENFEKFDDFRQNRPKTLKKPLRSDFIAPRSPARKKIGLSRFFYGITASNLTAPKNTKTKPKLIGPDQKKNRPKLAFGQFWPKLTDF